VSINELVGVFNWVFDFDFDSRFVDDDDGGFELGFVRVFEEGPGAEKLKLNAGLGLGLGEARACREWTSGCITRTSLSSSGSWSCSCSSCVADKTVGSFLFLALVLPLLGGFATVDGEGTRGISSLGVGLLSLGLGLGLVVKIVNVDRREYAKKGRARYASRQFPVRYSLLYPEIRSI
jgi:hypothetical protein